MKKTSLFLLLLLIFSLSWFIACQKPAKEDIKKEVKMARRSSTTMPITQGSADELVYQSADESEPMNLLSIAYNLGTKMANSTINLSGIEPITYELSFNDPLWKLQQTAHIEQKAADLSGFNLSLPEIQTTITRLEAIMADVIASASPAVLYSLSINISIFKTLERKAVNPDDCNCTVHPSYLVGRSYFLCQEDQAYNKSSLVTVLNQFETEFGQTANSSAIKQYAQSFQGTDIPFAQVYGLLMSSTEFDAALTNIKNHGGDCGWWCPKGCGSDHGCCGNYRGCCFFTHILCYVHDKICVNCQYQPFCLPGCKPGDIVDIPDPRDNTANPIDPQNPGSGISDSPRTLESGYYWLYINAVKTWAQNSMTEDVPVEYNIADVILKIDRFKATHLLDNVIPEMASEARFIYRVKNFVREQYFQFPGATAPGPEGMPDMPPFSN